MSRMDELRKRHESNARKLGMSVPVPVAPSEEYDPPVKSGGGGKGVVFAVVGLIALVAVGGVWFFINQNKDGRQVASNDLPPYINDGRASSRSDQPDYIASAAVNSGAGVEIPQSGERVIKTADGKRGMVFLYEGGKLHGEQRVYAGHKRPLRIFHCDKGKMHGSDTFYDLRGRVTRVVQWKEGVVAE